MAYFPRRLGYVVARVVADTVYLTSPGLRQHISQNMRHVLGHEVEGVMVRRAVRDVLRNTARNYFDLIKIPHMDLSDIDGCMVLHGWQHVEKAIARGRGIVFVTAHLGSFDLAVQLLAARSVRATIPVEPLKPTPLLKHVTALRNSKGLCFVPARSGVLEVLLQSLRRGEAVVLPCDRDINGDGMDVDFFGERTSLPTLAVRLAMRTGAAVVPAFNLRREDGDYDAFFEPAVDMALGGDGAVARNVEQVAHVMERYIRMRPEQWVVLNAVWANEVS